MHLTIEFGNLSREAMPDALLPGAMRGLLITRSTIHF
jgi:hypothetical protein